MHAFSHLRESLLWFSQKVCLPPQGWVHAALLTLGNPLLCLVLLPPPPAPLTPLALLLLLAQQHLHLSLAQPLAVASTPLQQKLLMWIPR